MEKFSLFKSYVSNEEDHTSHKKKHSYYALSHQDIENAELRMDLKFPEELHTFFEEIRVSLISDSGKAFMNTTKTEKFMMMIGF